MDTSGNESGYAITSATRPAAANSIKFNFQLDGSPLVDGYIADSGDLFATHLSNGYSYGWNKSHTADDRDRNKISDQLLDTLVQMQSSSTWSINLPNGSYTVKISVGDAQYTSNNTVNVNGVNYWSNLALNANQFQNKTMTINVTNGKLVIDNNGAPDRLTKLNYLEITPVTTQNTATKINFEPVSAPTVTGYLVDAGTAFADHGGISYGWNGDYSTNTRDRNLNANQLLDTLIHVSTGQSWSIGLANGNYNVTVSVGDPQYASLYTLNLNGASVFDHLSLGVNQFQQKTVAVSVSNGKLTMDALGSADRETRINYIEIASA